MVRDVNVVDEALLAELRTLVGAHQVLTGADATRAYRVGFRYGGGPVAAVVRPATLVELWRVAQACVDAGVIILMQASNTGLTGGSTPDGDGYDRPVVLVNTLRIDAVHLVDDGRQVVCLPGATLFELERRLKPLGREPHSVIGSSCIGASVLGGICNNSGGALVRRGPAYTELALYGQVDADGTLRLVNHLGIELGDEPEAMLERLEAGMWETGDVEPHPGRASDAGYDERVRDIDAATPARYNADAGRLHEASGCAGHLIVFAVRLDTFPLETQPSVFFVGANDPAVLEGIRRKMLASTLALPIAAEYMHRDIFEFTRVYGKDTFLAVKHLGSARLPGLFRAKARVDASMQHVPWLPERVSEYLLQGASRCFPEHLPVRLRKFGARFEHHLLLKVARDEADRVQALLADALTSAEGGFFLATEQEGDAAFLHRFAAAGSSGRYRAIHPREVENIIALDVALRRDDRDWFERLPPAFDEYISHKLYYGHFFCHVFHQIYVVKKGADIAALKEKLLTLLDARGARYPAEHNVGHLYRAAPAHEAFFRALDPINCLNPGIGKTSKRVRWR